jgi:hypothetical protein
MNETTTAGVRRLELRANQAVSLNGAPGIIVRALRGTIWLTQEALLGDRILIAGTRFVSDSRGKIVLSAIDGPGAVRIYEPCSGRPGPFGPGLQIDSGVIARIEREARHARTQEILRLTRRLGRFIASAWQHIKGETRKAKALPWRATDV